MNDKTDRRQARTKRLLHEAWIELVEEEGLDKITVSELAKRADVNRGTFYLHYDDISDMLERIKEELLEGMEKIIRRMNLRQLMSHASRDIPYPVIMELITLIKRNCNYFRVLLGPKGDPSFASDIKQIMRMHMYDKLKLYQPNESKMLLPRDFLIAYVSSANLGIIQHWIETGSSLSPAELTLLILRVIRHGPLTSTGIKEDGFAPGM